MRTATIIRLNAGNDQNGNPRRVYVGISPGGTISCAWDEGYAGHHAVPKRLRHKAACATTFNVTPKEYRDVVREFGA